MVLTPTTGLCFPQAPPGSSDYVPYRFFATSSAGVPTAHFRSITHDDADIAAFLERYATASHLGCNETSDSDPDAPEALEAFEEDAEAVEYFIDHLRDSGYTATSATSAFGAYWGEVYGLDRDDIRLQDDDQEVLTADDDAEGFWSSKNVSNATNTSSGIGGRRMLSSPLSAYDFVGPDDALELVAEERPILDQHLSRHLATSNQQLYNYVTLVTNKQGVKIPKGAKNGKDLEIEWEYGMGVRPCMSGQSCGGDPEAIVMYFGGALSADCPAGLTCFASGEVTSAAGTTTGNLNFDGEFCVGIELAADFGPFEAAIGAEGCAGGSVKRPTKGCCANGNYVLYLNARYALYGRVTIGSTGVEVKGGIYLKLGPLAMCAAPKERALKVKIKAKACYNLVFWKGCATFLRVGWKQRLGTSSACGPGGSTQNNGIKVYDQKASKIYGKNPKQYHSKRSNRPAHRKTGHDGDRLDLCLVGSGTTTNKQVNYDWCRDEDSVLFAHPCTFNKYLWDYDQNTRQIALTRSGTCYAQTVYSTASATSIPAANAACGSGQQHLNGGFSLHTDTAFKRAFHCCPKQGTTCGQYFSAKEKWEDAWDTCYNLCPGGQQRSAAGSCPGGSQQQGLGAWEICDENTIQNVCQTSNRAICQWGKQVEFRDKTCLEAPSSPTNSGSAGQRGVAVTKTCASSYQATQAWNMQMPNPTRIQNFEKNGNLHVCLSNSPTGLRTLYDGVNPTVPAYFWKCDRDRREEKVFMCGYAQDKGQKAGKSPCE